MAPPFPVQPDLRICNWCLGQGHIARAAGKPKATRGRQSLEHSDDWEASGLPPLTPQEDVPRRGPDTPQSESDELPEEAGVEGAEGRVLLMRDMLTRWSSRKQQALSDTMDQHLHWLNSFAEELRRRSKNLPVSAPLTAGPPLRARHYGPAQHRRIARASGGGRDIVIRIHVEDPT